MRPEDRDAARLWDIVHYGHNVAGALADRTLQDFLADEFLQMGVQRGIEIAGEACRALSEAFKASHPEIEWGQIIGLRNILAHDYTRVDHSRLWVIATVDLPLLVHSVEPLLESFGPNARREQE